MGQDRLRNSLGFLLQVLETPSYRLCLPTSQHREDWIPALHTHPCIEVATANFPRHKGWTRGLLKFSRVPSHEPNQNRKVYISSSHTPVFHRFLLSYHRFLILRLITNYVYFVFTEKPHIYKYFIFLFTNLKKKKRASSASWWKAIPLFNSMKQYWENQGRYNIHMQTKIYEAELELKPEWGSLLVRSECRAQVRHQCLHAGS